MITGMSPGRVKLPFHRHYDLDERKVRRTADFSADDVAIDAAVQSASHLRHPNNKRTTAICERSIGLALKWISIGLLHQHDEPR